MYFVSYFSAYDERLFEENMNIIEKLQSVGPKVNSRRFPAVNLTARSKRKFKSLSSEKPKKSPPQKVYKQKDQEKLFEQNMAIIEKLQSIDKKIKCWQDKSLMHSRIIREKTDQQKRKQILEKFKEISKEMKSLKPKPSSSRAALFSPYLVCQEQKRKKSEADHQTNANSFLVKKSAK